MDESPVKTQAATYAVMKDKLKSVQNLEFESGRSLWQDAWFRLRQNRLAMFGLWVIILLVLISLLTPWIAPWPLQRGM